MTTPKLIDPELPAIGDARRTPTCIGPPASILLPDIEPIAMKAGIIIVKSRPAEATIGDLSEVSNREWALASA